MIEAQILGTSTVLPGRTVETTELIAADCADEALAAFARRTGIKRRRWAAPHETWTSLGAQALAEAMDAALIGVEALRRIIFVSSGGGDRLVPANACVVAAAIGASVNCDAFDLNGGCVGFLTAFDLAARSVATGLGPIGIVVVELGSRCVRRANPKPYLVFGDVASAAIVGSARGGEGVLACRLATDARSEGSIRMMHPIATGSRAQLEFQRTTATMRRCARSALQSCVDGVFELSGMRLEQVAWVLVNQSHQAALDDLLAELGVDPVRAMRVYPDLGNVGAASLSVCLDRLRRGGRITPGDTILLCGVGAGVSAGAMLYRVASSDDRAALAPVAGGTSCPAP